MSTITIPAITAAEEVYLAARNAWLDGGCTEEDRRAMEAALRDVPLAIGMLAHCRSDILGMDLVKTNTDWTGDNPGTCVVREMLTITMARSGRKRMVRVTIEVTEFTLEEKLLPTDTGSGWLGVIRRIEENGKSVEVVAVA